MFDHWSRPGAEFERKRGHRHGGGGEGDTEDVATATGLVGSFESPQSTKSERAMRRHSSNSAIYDVQLELQAS